MHGNTLGIHLEHRPAKPLSVSQLIIQAINHLPFTSPTLTFEKKPKMSPTPYSLSTSISTFLSTHSSTTRSECDSLAQSLLSSPTISPVPIQGSFSYTVVASHSQLAQFRSPTSPLDVEVLRRARSIHGSLVADTTFHGQIGLERPLLVYVIEKLPGVTYLEWLMKGGLGRSLELDGERFERQRGLVGDFARYVNVCLFVWLVVCLNSLQERKKK